MQKMQFHDCFASWDGETLRLGNKNFERVYPVCNQQLAAGEMRAADGYVWGSLVQKNLLMTGRTDEMTVQMEQDDRAGLSDPHLKVTLRFTSDQYDFDRVLRIFPGHPFMSTEIYVRSCQPGALNRQQEKEVNTALERIITDPNAQMCRPDAIDILPIPSKHIKAEEILLRDRTDVNDWLVKRSDDALYANGVYQGKGNIFAIRDYLAGKTLLIVREAPVAFGMINPGDCDLRQTGSYLQVCGAGFTAEGVAEAAEGYGCTVGLADDAQLWQCYKEYHKAQASGNARHTGGTMSNTWGDRSRDAAVCHDFIMRELEAAGELGLDTLQIDDGWQKGRSANSAFANSSRWGRHYEQGQDFWDVNPDKFPYGLEPLVEKAKEYGINIGLWFSPDVTDDYTYWRQDADTLLRLYRKYGIRRFKLDGVRIENKIAESNYLRFLNAVRDESGDHISFNQDITAETRLGYLYESKYFGTLFVENRYTDWGCYFPHATLRNLWQLSAVFPPERFQFEVLNPRRNQHMYDGDPLAPIHYDIDYMFASVMVGSPLIWMELTGLHRDDVNRLKKIIKVYKEHRQAFARAQIIPIGQMPDGTGYTGFQIITDEKSGYLILLRECCAGEKGQYILSSIAESTVTLTALCANYDAPACQTVYTAGDGRVQIEIGKPGGYLFARYECG